jgi:hypothetical protein
MGGHRRTFAFLRQYNFMKFHAGFFRAKLPRSQEDKQAAAVFWRERESHFAVRKGLATGSYTFDAAL